MCEQYLTKLKKYMFTHKILKTQNNKNVNIQNNLNEIVLKDFSY